MSWDKDLNQVCPCRLCRNVHIAITHWDEACFSVRLDLNLRLDLEFWAKLDLKSQNPAPNPAQIKQPIRSLIWTGFSIVKSSPAFPKSSRGFANSAPNPAPNPAELEHFLVGLDFVKKQIQPWFSNPASLKNSPLIDLDTCLKPFPFTEALAPGTKRRNRYRHEGN